jgi:hypothetical protein
MGRIGDVGRSGVRMNEIELDELVYQRAIRLLVLGNGKHIREASPDPLHQW